MTKKPAPEAPIVRLEGWERDGRLYLDLFVYRQGQGMRRSTAHRRVILRPGIHLNEHEILVLMHRAIDYFLRGVRHLRPLQRGVPWTEVGRSALPVPPGGGEGGEDSSTKMWEDTPLPGM